MFSEVSRVVCGYQRRDGILKKQIYVEERNAKEQHKKTSVANLALKTIRV